MEWLSKILENPLYALLFGESGIVAGILSLISLKRKRKENLTVDLNKKVTEKRYNLEFESNPIIDWHEEYDEFEFHTEEFYETYLKTIEEKKKRGDRIDYK